MEFTKDIKFGRKPMNSKYLKLTYSGSLFKKNSSEVSIVYGFGEDWENTNEQKMQKLPIGFRAHIQMQNYDTFNFCFKNSNNEWDNNNGFNYIAPISELKESNNYISYKPNYSENNNLKNSEAVSNDTDNTPFEIANDKELENTSNRDDNFIDTIVKELSEEFEFYLSKIDEIKDNSNLDNGNVQDSAEANTQDGGNVQDSAEADAQDGDSVQDSAEADAQDGDNTQDSAEADTQDGDNVQDSAEADTQDGDNAQDSTEADTQDGDSVQDSAEADAQDGDSVQDSAEADAQDGDSVQDSAETDAQDGDTVQDSAEDQNNNSILSFEKLDSILNDIIQDIQSKEISINTEEKIDIGKELDELFVKTFSEYHSPVEDLSTEENYIPANNFDDVFAEEKISIPADEVDNKIENNRFDFNNLDFDFELNNNRKFSDSFYDDDDDYSINDSFSNIQEIVNNTVDDLNQEASNNTIEDKEFQNDLAEYDKIVSEYTEYFDNLIEEIVSAPSSYLSSSVSNEQVFENEKTELAISESEQLAVQNTESTSQAEGTTGVPKEYAIYDYKSHGIVFNFMRKCRLLVSSLFNKIPKLFGDKSSNNN